MNQVVLHRDRDKNSNQQFQQTFKPNIEFQLEDLHISSPEDLLSDFRVTISTTML